MRKLILISLFFCHYLVFSQIMDTSRVVVTEMSISNDQFTDDQIKLYVDSINNKSIKIDFIFNPCFDLNGVFWKTIHQPTTESVRWEIIKKVEDKNSLKKILNLNDKRLKEKCTNENSKDIPLINKSFYNLLRKRYSELKRKK